MKRSYSGYLYIVLCAVIFSTMEVMLKTVHGVFAPMQITCLRFLIGGLLLVPFALRSMKKKGAAFTRADVGFFALTGFLCVAFSMVLYQMAVTYTKASVVAIIFSCNPIFVTVLAYFLLREEIHRNHLVALALELLAVLIIIDPLHASLDPTGALLAIASALVFSFYYGQPGQYYDNSRYIRDWQVVAVVESCDANGMATLSLRNKFRAGDTVEVVGPDCKPFSMVVPEMRDAEGFTLLEPRNPRMIFTMQLPRSVPAMSFVRHAVDLSARD